MQRNHSLTQLHFCDPGTDHYLRQVQQWAPQLVEQSGEYLER